MGVVLISLAAVERGSGAATACAIYVASLIGLFAISATYHRHTWVSVRARTWMKRADHSMIFVFIAGTYTPIAALALPNGTATWVLIVVWAGAAGGTALKMFFPHAPRWLGVPFYLGLGWVAVFRLPGSLALRRRTRFQLAAGRRYFLHGRSGVLRDQAPEPVAPHFRVPRILPCGGHPGGDLSLRGHLVGRVLKIGSTDWLPAARPHVKNMKTVVEND